MELNFLSEKLVIADIEVDGSQAFDKTSIGGKLTAQSDLLVVIKKTNATDKITEVVVSHCDTNNGTFEEVGNLVLKEKLPIDDGTIYSKIGLKEDQLKKYVKVNATIKTSADAGSTSTASFIIASY